MMVVTETATGVLCDPDVKPFCGAVVVVVVVVRPAALCVLCRCALRRAALCCRLDPTMTVITETVTACSATLLCCALQCSTLRCAVLCRAGWTLRRWSSPRP